MCAILCVAVMLLLGKLVAIPAADVGKRLKLFHAAVKQVSHACCHTANYACCQHMPYSFA